MRHRPSAVLAAVGTAFALLGGCAATEPVGTGASPVVDTDAGPVRGTGAGSVHTFRAVPYAAPPVGGLRWAPARPPQPWTEPRDATAPGRLCAQDGLELGRPSTDEDCLTLDVTTPVDQGGPPRPVLVWVHGGSNVDGGGGLYGAARLAAEGGLVVVTINYRLGALGFLTHPALPGADNLGLTDQQAALGWVRRNATAFGGDPGNVTLAGESGGGAAVCTQLASPAADGLFDKAIVSSADCTATWSPERSTAPRPREVAQRRGQVIAQRLGCSDPATAAECLRNRSVPEVRAASELDGAGVGPVVGTPELPRDPATLLGEGALRDVPVMIGFNRDEERFRIYGEELGRGPTTLGHLRDEVTRLDGPDAPAVLAQYPCADDGCAATTLAELLTARNYARGVTDAADLLSSGAPVFAFEFADQRAPWFRELPPARFPQGAYHTAELPYLFDVDWAGPLDPQQQALATEMVGYWSRFARTGDPNGGDAPHWPPHTGPDSFQVLAPGPGGIHPAAGLADRHHLGFWAERSR
jgi:para-nitrobenzyl esterase